MTSRQHAHDDEVNELAEQFTKHFLSAECPECHAAIGEPCRGVSREGMFHVDRGLVGASDVS